MALNTQLYYMKVYPAGTPQVTDVLLPAASSFSGEDEIYFQVPAAFKAAVLVGFLAAQPDVSTGVTPTGSQGCAFDIWSAKTRIQEFAYKELPTGLPHEVYEPMQLAVSVSGSLRELIEVADRGPSVWADFTHMAPAYVAGVDYRIRPGRVWTNYTGGVTSGTLLFLLTTTI